MRFKIGKKIFSRWHLSEPLNSTEKTEYFQNLFERLWSFPYQDFVIQGLYLEGDRFFRRIELSEIKRVTMDEAEKIRRITPFSLKEEAVHPLVYDQGVLDVDILTLDFSVVEIKKTLEQIETHFTSLLDPLCRPELKIRFKGGINGHLYRTLAEKTIPRLPTGNYSYLTDRRSDTEGEFTLNSENVSLPDDILKRFKEKNLMKYFKIYNNDNTILLKKSGKTGLKIALFSSSISGFYEVLKIFQETEIIENREDKEAFQELPKLLLPWEKAS